MAAHANAYRHARAFGYAYGRTRECISACAHVQGALDDGLSRLGAAGAVMPPYSFFTEAAALRALHGVALGLRAFHAHRCARRMEGAQQRRSRTCIAGPRSHTGT